MKLSERLAQAATERANAAAAGTTVEDWRRQHDPGGGLRGEPPAAQARPPEVAVLVAPQHPVVAVDPEKNADPRAVCPTCGRTGELGIVDLHARTADWSCEECGTMWRVTLPSAPAPDTIPGD